MLINLIFSELAISVGLLLDFVGTLTEGTLIETNHHLCTLGGFIHTFFGNTPINKHYSAFFSC